MTFRVPSFRIRTTSSSNTQQPSPLMSPKIPTIIAEDNSDSNSADIRGIDFGLKLATTSALVEACVQRFDCEGELKAHNASFPKALFLVHKWFISSEELAKIFTGFYKTGIAESACQLPDCNHGGINCCVYHYKAQLCRALNFWIQSFPMHFDVDQSLRETVEALRREVLTDGYIPLSDLLDTSTVPSYAWMRNISVRNPVSRQASLSFDAWSADDIANSLTHYERKILRRISFQEYKTYAVTSNLKATPTLERSIAVFNGVSQWVQCMILNKATPQDRSEVVTKFVMVAKKLRKIQNFNTLMAIVGGLSHSSIARLAKTQECLSVDVRKDLLELTDLLSSACNFTNYRKVLAESRGFRIPIVGVHLKDLISLHSVIPDLLGNEINCKKLTQLAVIFAHLILDLEKAPNVSEGNSDFVNLLKVFLDIPHSDNEIYELSVRREPKTLRNCYNAEKTAVFAEWASGVRHIPDQETVHKHVTAMVEAVFKHYDHDRDGYISQAEFQSVAGSFPFIDAFGELDSDHDGKISKAEMIRYFVQANMHSIAFRRGFRHNFHETTFLTLTSCAHCHKILWGLLRQGFKCKDCAVPVHRACKDSLVAECVRKQTDRLSSDRLTLAVSSGPSSGDDSSDDCPFTNLAAVPKHSGFSSRLWPRGKARHFRAVSTASPESPTPATGAVKPDSCPFSCQAAHAGHHSNAGASFKRRAQSVGEDFRCHSPASGMDISPLLATEEVFEEEPSFADDNSNEFDNEAMDASSSNGNHLRCGPVPNPSLGVFKQTTITQL